MVRFNLDATVDTRGNGATETVNFQVDSDDVDEAIDYVVTDCIAHGWIIYGIINHETLAPLWTAKGIDP